MVHYNCIFNCNNHVHVYLDSFNILPVEGAKLMKILTIRCQEDYFFMKLVKISPKC